MLNQIVLNSLRGGRLQILGSLSLLLILGLTACSDHTVSTPTTAPVTQVASSVSSNANVATPEATPLPTALSTDQLKAQVRPLLGQLWQVYKDRYIQQDGRVRDPQRADASTSEGESYALLRAVWQDDHTTFDAVLNWTVNNLQLPRGDKLFAYLWGKNPDGSWKVIDKDDATDADEDIAFALLLAAKKWNNPGYQTQAQAILSDIWSKLTVNVKGQPYLTAGNWSPALAQPVLNPSYLAPYEYRLFAQIDPDKSHSWLSLVNTSYDVINNCTTDKLDTTAGKLPPNWCAIDKQSGNFVAASTQNKDFDSDFGYDAFRTIWRVALDYRWNNETRALNYLQSLQTLPNYWQTNHNLAITYDHSGHPKDKGEDLGIYSGGGVTLFTVTKPEFADQIVQYKLLPGLRNLGRDDPDPAHINAANARTYYAQNWTWFGLAFYSDALPQPLLNSNPSTALQK